MFWKSQSEIVFKYRFAKKSTFPAIFSFLRVVWSWFCYWRIPWSSRNVWNAYNIPLRCFRPPTPPFKVMFLPKKYSKSRFWMFWKSQSEIVFKYHFAKKNPHFLRYFHFYVSYGHDFVIDVYPGVQGMFGIPITYLYDAFAHPHSRLKWCSYQKSAQNRDFGCSENLNLMSFLSAIFW